MRSAPGSVSSFARSAWVEAAAGRIRLGEEHFCAGTADALGGRKERVADRNDRVAIADVQRSQRQVQSVASGATRHAALGTLVDRVLGLEGLGLRPEVVPRRSHDPFKGRSELAAEGSVQAQEVHKRDSGHGARASGLLRVDDCRLELRALRSHGLLGSRSAFGWLGSGRRFAWRILGGGVTSGGVTSGGVTSGGIASGGIASGGVTSRGVTSRGGCEELGGDGAVDADLAESSRDHLFEACRHVGLPVEVRTHALDPVLRRSVASQDGRLGLRELVRVVLELTLYAADLRFDQGVVLFAESTTGESNPVAVTSLVAGRSVLPQDPGEAAGCRDGYR